MAQLPLVLVYHIPQKYATFWGACCTISFPDGILCSAPFQVGNFFHRFSLHGPAEPNTGQTPIPRRGEIGTVTWDENNF